MNIEIKERIIVNNAGKYDAEIITGAKINIAKGFIIPPVKNNKIPSCRVSNNKNKNAFMLFIVLFFLSKKYE